MYEELMYLIAPMHRKNLIVKIPCIHLVFINNPLKLEILLCSILSNADNF